MRLHGEFRRRLLKSRQSRASSPCLQPEHRKSHRPLAADWPLSVSQSSGLPSAANERVLENRSPPHTPSFHDIQRPSLIWLLESYHLDAENVQVSSLCRSPAKTDSSAFASYSVAVYPATNSGFHRFLSIASSYPYVMHALLSFSANHLAWMHSSAETRNLHIQHGSIALRGLHEAIGNFSQSNADAILAASLLMLWQATDW